MSEYRQAKWNEPIIFEKGHKGKRGHTVPRTEEKISKIVGNVLDCLPNRMRRKALPNLPEVSESEVMTHFLRLSQQNFGFDSGISMGSGTCTMKYSPKVNELLARSPKMAEIHPYQDEDTIQGILEVMYRASKWFCEIAGMDEFSLQPAGGCHGIFTNACIVREYHRYNGELEQREEMLVPILSHPCNAISPATAGFKIISLFPDESGCVDVEAVKEAVSKHTAGMMMTNPYDIGVFDNNIGEFVKIVHEVGGLMVWDMANFNGLLGVVRPGDIGFDICHINAHKSFSTPHGSGGPAHAPIGVKEHLKEFLPVPLVECDEGRYRLNYDLPHSIGKVRGFYGNVANTVRAYAWMMALGAEGLREVAEIAVINNNYMISKMLKVPGVSLPFAEGRPRIEQAKFSLQKIKEDTGIGTEEINDRIDLSRYCLFEF